jgi:hypothetical protein
MPGPELAPRRTVGGVIGVWVAAALGGVAIGIFVAPELRAAWLIVALGVSVILSFLVQLSYGRSQQFVERVAASALGALVVLGVISAGFGLATFVLGFSAAVGG